MCVVTACGDDGGDCQFYFYGVLRMDILIRMKVNDVIPTDTPENSAMVTTSNYFSSRPYREFNVYDVFTWVAHRFISLPSHHQRDEVTRDSDEENVN